MDFSPSCAAAISRGLHWNATAAGTRAIQRCPANATGLARWRCGVDAEWVGAQPELWDCKSAELRELESSARQQQEDDEEAVVSQLVRITTAPVAQSPRVIPLYGGDLESITGILRSVANRMEYHLQQGAVIDASERVRRLLRHVVRSCANLLAPAVSWPLWADLNAKKRSKAADDLTNALVKHAFILAAVQEDQEISIVEKTREIGKS